MCFYARFMVLLLYFAPTLHMCVHRRDDDDDSLYLAFFFAISHNFGVKFVGEEAGGIARAAAHEAPGRDELQRAGPRSRSQRRAQLPDRAPPLPRVHHSYYPKLAPYVRPFLEARGITYKHYPTLAENFVSFVKHLYMMGHSHPPHQQSEWAKGVRDEFNELAANASALKQD